MGDPLPQTDLAASALVLVTFLHVPDALLTRYIARRRCIQIVGRPGVQYDRLRLRWILQQIMRGNRWGPDGPPPEAYSRVTNPARFQPLHEFATELLRQLEADFDVQRLEGYGLDPELENAELGQPTVRLTPLQSSAAPIVVAFTAFPGLTLRCGRWLVERFPACGCDACDATAEGEAERFGDLLDNVIQGRFQESISIPLLGAAWYEYELGKPWHGPGRRRLTRSRARALVGEGERSFDWQPWPAR